MATTDLDSRGSFELLGKVRKDRVPVDAGELDFVLDLLEPIRKPYVSYKSKNMPGKWFSPIAGRHVQYDSLLERSCLLQLEFEGCFSDLVEQPFRLRFKVGDQSRSHVPDFLLRKHSGSLTLVDVKPAARAIEPHFVEQFERTADFCRQEGIEYRVMSEADPQLLENLRWLCGYRDVPLDHSIDFTRMWTMLEEGPRSFAELIESGEVECLARPVLFGGLWSRHFSTDLLQPFTRETEIRRSDVSSTGRNGGQGLV